MQSNSRYSFVIVNSSKQLAIPNDITIEEFTYNERYGRRSVMQSLRPFTCGLTGRSYTAAEVKQRVDFLARALAKRTGWNISESTEWERVACIYSLNTVSNIFSALVDNFPPN